MELTGIVDFIAERVKDPRDQNKITYPIRELLRTILILFCQGYNDISDVALLENDPAFALGGDSRRGVAPLEEGKRIASQSTMSRLRSLLSTPGNLKVLREAVIETASRIRKLHAGEGKLQKSMNIDIDGLAMEAHGHQPGVRYNGHYRKYMHYPVPFIKLESSEENKKQV